MFLNVVSVNAQEITSLKDTLKVDGDVSLRNVLYTMGGTEDRRVPYSFVLGANITISKGEFSLPFGFTYSEQERNFSQPFNQFGITPEYKWIKGYAGFNSLDWNNYTLNGMQFLGGGVELTPKKFRFGFMYGRFQRATAIDSIGFIEKSTSNPAYKRTGWASKVGVGTESSFIDLIVFKGKDQIQNFSPILKDSVTPVFAAENTSVGIKTKLALASFLSFNMDVGVSVFNRDQNAPTLDTTEQTSALLLFNSIHNVNLSTSVFYGGDASLQFNVKGQTLSLKSKYVLPDYQSMGIYYMDNDVFSYGFDHSFSAWKSKIYLNYGLNRLNDNLLNKKEVTTIRIQPIVNLSFNPSLKWGIETNWNNYYTRQENGTIELSDSFRIAQANPGLTITPHAQWGDTVVYYSVYGLYTKMQLVDNNPLTAINSQYTATVYGLNYAQSLLKQNMSLSVGLNQTLSENNYTREKALGINLGANKSDDKSKWNAGVNLGLQFSNLSNNFSLGLNGQYNLKKKQRIDLSLTTLRSNAKEPSANSFTELTFVVNYTKNFQYAHKKKK